MSIKIPRPLLFILAFTLAFLAYWPLIHGTPIWDDFNFWFRDPVMKPDFSYVTIWKDFGWPFSVSLQKFLLSVWNKNYFYYHVFNFVLHGINSFLVYLLGRRLRLKYNFLYFMLFLLHPVAVITTGWMVQIKTLLCFTFGLASLLTFMKGHKNLKWMSFAWVLFFLSVASKSAGLTLPLIFLAISFKTQKFKNLHYLIPFFLISAWGGYRMLTSFVTTEGSAKASKITTTTEVEPAKPVEIKPEVKVEAKPIHKPLPKPEVKVEKEKVPEPPKEMPKPAVNISAEGKTSLSFISLNLSLALQTSYYYFWQTLLPINNVPVKGLNFSKVGIEEYVHLFFLGVLVYLLWSDVGLIYLIAAHFLLIPFLGIIPAPFMNITWVSDQHLYLALPAFLALWVRLVERIPWKHAYVILVAFVILFGIKTQEAAPTYQSQFTFFEKSLRYNPYNVPLSYNLAFAYLMEGDWNNAYYTVSDAFHLSEDEPRMRQNAYFPYLAMLYFQMRQGLEKPNEN